MDKEEKIREVQREIDKFKEKEKQINEITERAINKIVIMALEDWKGTIKTMDGDKVKFFTGEIKEEIKKYNFSSNFSNIEEMNFFLHLILKETQRFLNNIDLNELKKLKL